MEISKKIAVIGIACRFPCAENKDEFLDILRNGTDCISRGKSEEEGFVRAYGKINNENSFDESLFSFGSSALKTADPQVRFLIELCYQAMRDGGIRVSDNNDIGLFAGADYFSYVWKGVHYKGNSIDPESYAAKTFLDGSLASRAAFHLNLAGPNLTVKGACATSLAAIHLAAKSIANGECSMALAGGVNLSWTDGYYPAESALSPSGVVRPFSEDADGFVPGDGGGIVILKDYEQSIRDKNHIYSVILGSALGGDGNNKIGFTAPSVEGERKTILKAWQSAGITADDVDYIETHGTATRLGDEIEAEALGQLSEERTRPLIIGSVKSNVGHLNIAAGVAGFIKTALMLDNNCIFPTINCTCPSECLEEYGLVLAQKFEKYSRESFCAGVSSFGIGGVNCHIVMKRHIKENISDEPQGALILPFSAASRTAIDKTVKMYSEYISNFSERDVLNSVYTLQNGISDEKYRKIYVVNEFDIEKLKYTLSKREIAVECIDDGRKKIFMFPGNNRYQWKSVLRLYNTDSIIKKYLDEAFSTVETETGESFYSMFDSDELPEFHRNMLGLCFGYAAAKMLIDTTGRPDAVLGYSMGEYTAACIAGSITFAQAVRINYERLKLFADVPEGRILSVAAEEKDIERFLENDTWVSADNTTERLLVSGTESGISRLKASLDNAEIYSTELPLNRAGHCPLVREAAGKLLKIISNETFSEPKIPFVSSMLGRFVRKGEITKPSYWADHMMSKVNFNSAISELCRRYNCNAVEVGFGEQLVNFFNNHLSHGDNTAFSLITNRFPDPVRAYYYGIGSMWAHGFKVNWKKVCGDFGSLIPLPPYPFERTEVDDCYASLAKSDNNSENVLVVDGYSESACELTKMLAGSGSVVTAVMPDASKVHDNICKLEDKLKKVCSEVDSNSSVKTIWEYDGLTERFDRLCVSACAEYFGKYIDKSMIGEKFTEEELSVLTCVNENYRIYFRLMLDILEKADIIEHKGKNVTFLKQLDSVSSIEMERNNCFGETACFEEYTDFFCDCMKELPRVLNGEILGKSLIYPDGSHSRLFDIAEKVPETSRVRLSVEMLSAAAAEIYAGANRKIRIFEGGGGTGMLTHSLMKALDRKNIEYEYWFTDIGHSFIGKLKEECEMTGRTNVVFRKADVSKPFHKQGIPKGYFDMIVSCNVIQATSNMEKTLVNISSLLVHNGLACFVQTIDGHDLTQMLFGLNPEWWNFAADPLRGKYPVISCDEWRAMLGRSGFDNTFIYFGEENRRSDASVIISEKNDNTDEIIDGTDVIYVDSYSYNSIKVLKEKYFQSRLVIPSYIRFDDEHEVIQSRCSDLRNDIDRQLELMIKKLFAIEISSVQQSFYEIDIDSLSALMICSKVKKCFNIPFTMRELSGCVCIADLSDKINEMINERKSNND